MGGVLGGHGGTGSPSGLTGTPDLAGFAESADLAAVATSGLFADLRDLPAGLADGDDADTLARLDCAEGQVAKRTDGVWQCAADADADVCAEALACPAVLDIESRLDQAEAGLAAALQRIELAESDLAEAGARLAEAEAALAEGVEQRGAVWCLLNCDPQRLGDCRARTCDGASQTCADAGQQPEGTTCGGGRGRCVGGECFGAFCTGLSCPYLPGYRVGCNVRGHCEYAPVDGPGWRQWDVWIWVPAGPFHMGAPASEAGSTYEERPVHEVTQAEGFLVMKHEIVVAQYLVCESAGRCTAPSTADWDGWGWGLNRATNGRENHPQNGLTWQQAQDFCAWVAPGGRLPSEAEWEHAASGPVHRKYPWGDSPEPSCEAAVYDPDGSTSPPWGCEACTEWGCSGTQPVGERPSGASSVGALDMAGNVWEWCADWYHSTYAGAPVDGSAWVEPSGANRVLRGGGFYNAAPYLRTSARGADTPTDRSAYYGARCVRPLPQQAPRPRHRRQRGPRCAMEPSGPRSPGTTRAPAEPLFPPRAPRRRRSRNLKN